MAKLARRIVFLDGALLDWVFQPAVDRLARVRGARYRLAAAAIDLCAGACLASVAITVARAGDPLGAAARHGIIVAVLLLGLAAGRHMVARTRWWDELEASIGLERRNPNRATLRPYRLAMLAAGLGCLVAVATDHHAAFELVFTAYLWALAASAYMLSCDDPRPRPRREAKRLTRLAPQSG
jgi:hypothetical protein